MIWMLISFDTKWPQSNEVLDCWAMGSTSLSCSWCRDLAVLFSSELYVLRVLTWVVQSSSTSFPCGLCQAGNGRNLLVECQHTTCCPFCYQELRPKKQRASVLFLCAMILLRQGKQTPALWPSQKQRYPVHQGQGTEQAGNIRERYSEDMDAIRAWGYSECLNQFTLTAVVPLVFSRLVLLQNNLS